MDLTSEFAKRGPWITRFVIDGVESGGKFDTLADARVDQFFECFPNVRTIPDLGSLEGGQTFALARHPGVERVFGIEARAANTIRIAGNELKHPNGPAVTLAAATTTLSSAFL